MTAADVLNASQLAAVKQKSDLRGAGIVVWQWAITVGVFVAVGLWTNVFSVVLGTLLLGGRQLGFFVLTHECGHRTLFASPRLNELVGDWLLSATDFTNPRAYMREHLEHHRSAGTRDDPDLSNYADYPISRARLRRKLLRDITGRTGARILAAKVKMLLTLPRLDAENRASMLRGLVVNLVMLTTLLLAGEGALYLMWLAAMVFVQPLVSRIRQIAEHAAVPDLSSDDPRANTRTVLANPLLRLLICPHGVNYHIEHHLLASVPIYRLPLLHRSLERAGYFADVEFSPGYLSMLRQVTHRPAVPA